MSNGLQEKIKTDNNLTNFLKTPGELFEEKLGAEKLDALNRKIAYYLSEQYTRENSHSRLKSLLKDTFYAVKPLVPRFIQIGLRKKYLFFQKKTDFPSWPTDLSLYDTYKKGIQEILTLTGLTELPFINFWPKGKKFALVLTHDVETAEGQKNIWNVKEIEEELGFRSSWNFVPERYRIDDRLVRELRESGFEIGIHGLKHDGKLFKNQQIFQERAPRINHYLKKYDCYGFRSPMTWRNYEYMQSLEIKYDLSFFDSDIFEGQAGGTLSFHPFLLGKFVELPYTLPQDHTLFILLEEKDDKIWENKMKVIRQFQGMALMITHPDYLIKKNLLNTYREFLLKLKKMPDYWHALPKEVAEWWSRRAKCILKRKDDKWQISPPLEGASLGTLRLKEGEVIFG